MRRSSCPRRVFWPARSLALVLAGDRRDRPSRALKAEDGSPELGIKHVAVGHDQHGVEQFFMFGVVEIGQEVGGPSDGIGFPGTSRVLD